MYDFSEFLVRDLQEISKQLDIPVKSGVKKDGLIKSIAKWIKDCEAEQNERVDIADGFLEIFADGYGFLRNTSVEKDIYVSASQIRKFKLRTGDNILGVVRQPAEDDRNYALKKVIQVNHKSTAVAEARQAFEELVPSYATTQFVLGGTSTNISGRILDIIAPIGKGQRALIISPPKAGKTMLLTSIANSLLANNKDKNLSVWMLLVDERPEEVTDIMENVNGAETFASTFDENPENHIKVTQNVLEKAKAKVENGENVVILMDSLTRLARAYNTVIPSSGKLISGGIDPVALYYPKNFFGAARNVRDGGSLTIIATVLIDTGSKMDEVIYEEFKSTGNCDIHLDRTLAELRIFPAIDIQRSGTRKEELLIGKDKLESIWKLRRFLADFDKATASKKLIEAIKNTRNNDELVKMLQKGR